METRTQTRADVAISDDGDARSLAQLARELRDESIALMRDELRLAKTEISEKVSRVARNGAYMTAGAMVAHAALVVLLLAASAALYAGLVAAGFSHMLAGWLSLLLVGVVAAIVGYALVQKAISSLSRESAVPARTVESLQDDKQWLERKVQ